MYRSPAMGHTAASADVRMPLRRRAGMVLTAGMVVGTSLAAMAATSSAAASTTLPKSLAMFAHCPIGNKKVAVCLYGSTGGTFQVGEASLTLPSPAVLTLGLIESPSGKITAVDPTDGTLPLDAPTTEIPVAGSLVEVGATPVLSGLPTINLVNLLTAKGVATSLPLVVNLSNPALGSTCTLGTSTAPLTVNLTDGKTDPPPPNTPVTGSKGTLTSTNQGLLSAKGVKLVDNAFAAPGASGCGPLGLEDPVVDELEGLPAAAGTNSAALKGNIYTVPASVIRKYLG